LAKGAANEFGTAFKGLMLSESDLDLIEITATGDGSLPVALELRVNSILCTKNPRYR
jgi:hypothetical protein